MTQITPSEVNASAALNVCTLPAEVQVDIFHHLNPMEICIAARVCRLWQTMTDDNVIWKMKTAEKWPKCTGEHLPSWKRIYQLNRLYRKSTPVLLDSSFLHIGYNNSIFLWYNDVLHLSPPNTVLPIDHSAPITTLQPLGHDENKRLITGSADGTIRIWEIEHRILTGIQQIKLFCRNILLNEDAITALIVKRKWIIAGSADSTLGIWENDAKKDEVNKCAYLREHEGAITALQSGQDDSNGYIFYSGSEDKTIRVWRISPDKKVTCTQVIKGLSGIITCFAWPTTDSFLYAGTSDNKILVWNIKTLGKLALVASINAHDQPLTCLCAVRFPSCIISGSEDGMVKIWKKNPTKNEWTQAHWGLPFASGISQIAIFDIPPNIKKMTVVCKNHEVFLYDCDPMPTIIRYIQKLAFKDPEEA